MAVGVVEAAFGLLLVFFVPGFAVAKAVFPERRLRSLDGLLWLVELGTLSLILSVVLTILVGYGLLLVAPSGFSASWSNPDLEVALGAITVGGVFVGWVRGAYRRTPPKGPELEPSPGADDGWELLRSLELKGREERRLRHRLRAGSASAEERQRLEADLARVQQEMGRLKADREAEYAG